MPGLERMTMEGKAKAGASDWMEAIRFEGGEMRFPPRGEQAGVQGTPAAELADGDVALISLGNYCGVKLSFRKLGLGAATLPFDWMRTRIEKVIEFLRTDFSTFYGGLSDPIEVPGTNLSAFRGYGHSFWHDDIREPETRTKLGRRIGRLMELGRTSPTTLFVRALCTTDELCHVDDLHKELLRKFDLGGANRVFLLAIVCMQERTQGPVVSSSSPGLLVWCLSPSAHDSEKYGGEPAPFCEPVSWALEFIRGSSSAAVRSVSSAAALLASGEVDPNTMGLDGMNGILSFEGPPAQAERARFPVGSRVEAEYRGNWYLATVLATPKTDGAHWEVHCHADPQGTSTITYKVRAAPLVPTSDGAAEAAAAAATPAEESPRIDWSVEQAGQSDWMDAISFDKDGEMSCPPMEGSWSPRAPGGHTREGVALVSLGCFCGVKLSFQRMGIGAATLPLDWMRTRIEKVIEFLRTDFATLYDGLNGPVIVPHTNLIAFRGSGHSFWHDDIREPEVRSKLQRRIDRLMELGRSSPVTLFVRALATTSELSRVDELYAELRRKFGGEGKRIFLLVIVCMQERAHGPMLSRASPGLLIYFLSGKAHDKEGGEPAPFCEPIRWALEHVEGGGSGRGLANLRTVPRAASLLEGSEVDPDDFGLHGMEGVASFESSQAGGEHFPVGSRVEAQYEGQWYSATVLALPEVAWGNLWKVHCDVDPKDVNLTTPRLRALCA